MTGGKLKLWIQQKFCCHSSFSIDNGPSEEEENDAVALLVETAPTTTINVQDSIYVNNVITTATTTIATNLPLAQLHQCPLFVWIGLKRCGDRRARMEQRLRACGFVTTAMHDDKAKLQNPFENRRSCQVNRKLRYPASYYSEGLDGSSSELWVSASLASLDIETLQNSQTEEIQTWSTLKNGPAIATTISHLRTLKHLLETRPAAYFWLNEDDATFEHCHQWGRPLHCYLQELTEQVPNWEILQLGTQGPRFCKVMETSNHAGILTVPWNLYHYGTYSYIITRAGIQKLIERYWCVDEQRWSLYSPRATVYRNYPYIAADCILYDSLSSWTSTIPWMVYEGFDSTIHEENLERHNLHLARVRAYYAAAAVEKSIQFYPPSHQLTRFAILINGHNNSEAVCNCLDSVLQQKYPLDRFRILYVDDASTDGVLEKIQGWLDQNDRHWMVEEQSRNGNDNILSTFMTLILPRNELEKQRNYAAFRRDQLLQYCSDDEVVLLLDGDDCLADPHVLGYLEQVYRNSSLWLTYGGYVSNCLRRTDWGDWSPEAKREFGGIRKSGQWFGSPLRSFRASLYRNHFHQADLLNPDGEYWECATDVAIMIPLLEMAGPEHSLHIDDGRILYIYNIDMEKQYEAERVKQQRENAKLIFETYPHYLPL